jgi:hypothetical protein
MLYGSMAPQYGGFSCGGWRRLRCLEDSWEYNKLGTLDGRKMGGPATWLDEGLTTHPKNRLLRSVVQGVGIGRMVWNDLGNGKWI